MTAASPGLVARILAPIRGLVWLALVLFCLNAMLDALVFHGIALSSTRKAGQPINWAATPYTSLRVASYGRRVKYARLSASNWYPKDLVISKSGFSRAMRDSDKAGADLVNRFTKP
jgi:hypothetical protein